MLAAAVPSDFAGEVADFGAGAGAAGLAVHRAMPDRPDAVLVEREPEMAAFARQTLAHPGNAAIAARASVSSSQTSTLSGKKRTEAGLADRAFDFVIMNPPFNMRRRPVEPRSVEARGACDGRRHLRSLAAHRRGDGETSAAGCRSSPGRSRFSADPCCARRPVRQRPHPADPSAHRRSGDPHRCAGGARGAWRSVARAAAVPA